MSGKKTGINSSLIDQFGRRHNYLRLSVTEKCNFRCSYCLPDNKHCNTSGEPLSPSEIGKIAMEFVRLGITKIRLTGGEPLFRKDFSSIADELGPLNVEKAITTNGALLDRYIENLKKNKFHTINISLDTLDPGKFKTITGNNNFKKVFHNILLALSAGIQVKINTVVIKHLNDQEILSFAALTKNLPLTVRFIEFMPFKDNDWNFGKIVSQDKILNILHMHHDVYPVERVDHTSPANYYSLGNHVGKIGIISTVSKPFCEACNRIRITSDGKIKNCLFGNGEIDLIQSIRENKNLSEILNQSLSQKSFQHGNKKLYKYSDKDEGQNRGMYAIGG
jgi:molybdenum cofactor biosynthesis protein A